MTSANPSSRKRNSTDKARTHTVRLVGVAPSSTSGT